MIFILLFIKYLQKRKIFLKNAQKLLFSWANLKISLKITKKFQYSQKFIIFSLFHPHVRSNIVKQLFRHPTHKQNSKKKIFSIFKVKILSRSWYDKCVLRVFKKGKISKQIHHNFFYSRNKNSNKDTFFIDQTNKISIKKIQKQKD